MNSGNWNGKQLLSRDYVNAATSWQIDNSVSASSIETRHGYGYQFWRLRNEGFAMYGMGSQYALCLPNQGTILVTTADTQGTESAGDAIIDMYFRLVKKLSPDPLPENISAQNKLKERISRLAIPLPLGAKETPLAKEISGRKYILDKNPAGMKWLRLNVGAGKCRLQYENESGEHELLFGMDVYAPQMFPEKYYGMQIGVKDTHYKCIGAGAWAEEKAFLGTIYAVDDYLGSIKFQLTFTGNEICGFMTKAAEWFFDEYHGFIVGLSNE